MDPDSFGANIKIVPTASQIQASVPQSRVEGSSTSNNDLNLVMKANVFKPGDKLIADISVLNTRPFEEVRFTLQQTANYKITNKWFRTRTKEVITPICSEKVNFDGTIPM
jgi:hypothetical protein